MKILTPNYYPAFRCIASACPDSCCKEWEVDVDDTAAAFYRTLEGPLGDPILPESGTDRPGATWGSGHR